MYTYMRQCMKRPKAIKINIIIKYKNKQTGCIHFACHICISLFLYPYIYLHIYVLCYYNVIQSEYNLYLSILELTFFRNYSQLSQVCILKTADMK